MINGIGFDSQTFGAQVVTKTMDYMNGTNFGSNMGGASSLAPMDKQTFGASVVTQTLDTMNQPMGDMNNSYDFQTQVLGAYTMGKGTIVDAMY